jgi:hypothetical protein
MWHVVHRLRLGVEGGDDGCCSVSTWRLGLLSAAVVSRGKEAVALIILASLGKVRSTQLSKEKERSIVNVCC